MKTAAPPLLPLFRSRLQGEILAVCYAHPNRDYTARQLAEHLDTAYPTVVQELDRLTTATILTVRHAGRTKLVAANTQHPHYPALSQLVLATFGPPEIIADTFTGIPGIESLWIFGSWARRLHGQPGPPPGDIDLLIIGTPRPSDIHRAADTASRRIGIDINPVTRTPDQYTHPENDQLLTTINTQPLHQIRC